MQEKWLTKEADLALADEIIRKYLDLNAGEPLGLFEVQVGDAMDLQISEWVLELAEEFQNKYGETKGDLITKRVISNCITKGQTIH